MIRLISWNINGIRAAIKKGLWNKVETLNPDIFCVQETKADSSVMATPISDNPGYHLTYHSATVKKGYSGVATYSHAQLHNTLKNENDLFEENSDENSKSISHNQQLILASQQSGINIPQFDQEGRAVITHYSVPNSALGSFVLINCYYPQGGRGQHRIDYKIAFYAEIKKIAAQFMKDSKHVILCGDFNTTVADIDLARPAQNRKTTGCLPEEREALDWFLKDGFVDTFRHFYPNKPDRYSYWDQITKARDRNVGWRIDYFLISKSLLPFLHSADIHDQVFGSDHAPVSVELNTEW